MKNHMENGLSELLDLQVQTIYMSDQYTLPWKDSGIYDEGGEKNIISNPLTETQRQSGIFLSFMMMVHTRMNQTAIKVAWIVGTVFNCH